MQLLFLLLCAHQSNSAYGSLSDVPVAYEASRSTVSIGASGNASGGAGYFAGLSKQEREKEFLRREEHAAAREKELDLRCVFVFISQSSDHYWSTLIYSYHGSFPFMTLEFYVYIELSTKQGA